MRLALLILLAGTMAALPLDVRAHCDHAADDPSHDHHHDHGLDLGIFDWSGDHEATRVQVLDLALFSLVDVHSHKPDYRHVEVLHVPLVTGFESRRTPHGSELRVLAVPFFSLFERESADARSNLGVLNLPLVGSLFSQRVDHGRVRTNLLFLMRFEKPVANAP